jgi:carbamoyltransferase
MRILGISAYFHDSAVALVEDGVVVAAAQEERFSRVKHDARFPAGALRWLASEHGLSPETIDAVVFFEKPFLKFERIVESAVAVAPRGWRSFAYSMPLWVRDKLFLRRMLSAELTEALGAPVPLDRLRFSEHHLSHAASAFYPSPFDEAVVITMDAVGEWATTSVAHGRGNDLSILRELHFPHSIGMLYSAFTQYCGFRVNSGEYKLMGLAPYGEPRFAELIHREFLELRPDGSFWVDQRRLGYLTGLTMTNRRFHDLFGGPPRQEHEPITASHMDLAASIQAVTEDVVINLVRASRELTGIADVCLAGGVALNCVANGRLVREGVVDRLWVQPAAGDAGGALGAALAVWHLEHGGARPHLADTASGPEASGMRTDGMRGSLLGPGFDDLEAAAELTAAGAVLETLSDHELINRAADLLADGAAIGWFRGRAEFGPRALGNRSILADPRPASMQRDLNLKIKFREGFRPFAPVVLEERCAAWFELDTESPYMLLVAQVAAAVRQVASAADDGDAGDAEAAPTGFARLDDVRSTIPAVTHVDGSARIQTVAAGTNPDLHALLSAFEARTGCPVLVNTSFNIRGEPIVGSPHDAWRCFMGTDLDALVVGNHLLLKSAQPEHLRRDYRDRYGQD